jgi:hypothetical protein
LSAAELRPAARTAGKSGSTGALFFGRDEYHRNAEIDQYRPPVELKAGANTIPVE